MQVLVSVVEVTHEHTNHHSVTSSSLNDILLVCLIGICIIICFIVIGTAAVCFKRSERQLLLKKRNTLS